METGVSVIAQTVRHKTARLKFAKEHGKNISIPGILAAHSDETKMDLARTTAVTA